MFKNLVLISFISLPLASENLLDIYNEALDNDPQYKSSEYSLLAGKEFVVQGRAGLLPNVTLSGSTNWNEYYQFDELQSAYNNSSVTARLTQPLFRLDSWFNFRRSKKLTDASEADFAYAQQNLIIRTVEKYFGVLRAIDNLNAAVSEEKAIKKQLDQIQQRFEVGLSAITEVQEAQLAYDLSVAAKIRSEGALFNAREELNSLIGRDFKHQHFEEMHHKIQLEAQPLSTYQKLILLEQNRNQIPINIHMKVLKILVFKLPVRHKERTIASAFQYRSLKVVLSVQEEGRPMPNTIELLKKHFLRKEQ
jgi:outer membrane protein TolC